MRAIDASAASRSGSAMEPRLPSLLGPSGKVLATLLIGGLAPVVAWAQDADGDGFTTDQGDCDDGDPSVHPYATELCAGGVDENCNGIVDETHSWYLMGTFLIDEQWENIGSIGSIGAAAVSGEQLAAGFGVAEDDELFLLGIVLADCADRAEVLFDGTAIRCTEDDDPRDDARVYGHGCSGHDTGVTSVRVDAYDLLDNRVGESAAIFYGVDAVPSDLRITGPTTLVEGEAGCWRPQVETGEPLDIVRIQAPDGVRILDDRTGGDTLCWTPLAADIGEHAVSFDVDDYEGNLFTGEFRVSVVASAGEPACGCRHPSPAPGLQFALMILIVAIGRRGCVREV